MQCRSTVPQTWLEAVISRHQSKDEANIGTGMRRFYERHRSLKSAEEVSQIKLLPIKSKLHIHQQHFKRKGDHCGVRSNEKRAIFVGSSFQWIYRMVWGYRVSTCGKSRLLCFPAWLEPLFQTFHINHQQIRSED